MLHRPLSTLVIAVLAAASLACTAGTNNSARNTSLGVPAAAGSPASLPVRSTGTPVASFPLTVKRSDGTDLVIKSAPKRIASLSAGTTEIFYAIGAQSQLIATDKYSDFPEQAKNTTKLDGFRPSLEEITALSPDLVVVVDNQQQVVENLDRLGIAVLYLKVPASLQETLQQIQFYGDVTAHPGEAQRVAAGMRARIDAVQRKLTGIQQGPRVYTEIDVKLFSAAPNSFIGDLMSTVKAQNIVPAGQKPYPQITQEFIIAKDPEVIILADVELGESADTVKARPGWSAISAVRNGRVYGIDTNLVERPGPRIVDGLEALAKALYPDKF